MALHRNNDTHKQMSIFDFRDVINDFIFSANEDLVLTRKVCRIAKRQEKNLIYAFKQIDQLQKGIKLKDIRFVIN